MSALKEKRRSQRNFIISCAIAVAALLYFAMRGPNPKNTQQAAEQKDLPSGSSVSVPAPDTTVFQASSLPAPAPAKIPSGLPDDLVRSLNSPPPDLPEDLKAQLNAPPPELPEDLKKQLMNPVRELPPDLKAQLEAPPPELPDDIKQALKTPPRVVTLDEVNKPPDPGM